jgi:hypothetical protein
MGSRKVCFIDDEGQVGICLKEINDENTDCSVCEYNEYKPGNFFNRPFDPPV